MLNPIEFCFSKVVGYVKAAEVGSNCTLFESIDQAFAAVTASDCAGWFRKSKSYFNQCLTEQKIICQNEIEEDVELEIEVEVQDQSVDELVCDHE